MNYWVDWMSVGSPPTEEDLRGPQKRALGTQTPEAEVGTVRLLLDQHLAAPLGTRFLGPSTDA